MGKFWNYGNPVQERADLDRFQSKEEVLVVFDEVPHPERLNGKVQLNFWQKYNHPAK
jgi:hypothetical protein